jgi:hypothetical protein
LPFAAASADRALRAISSLVVLLAVMAGLVPLVSG